MDNNCGVHCGFRVGKIHVLVQWGTGQEVDLAVSCSDFFTVRKTWIFIECFESNF